MTVLQSGSGKECAGMNVKTFSDAMGEIDGRYIDEAINYEKTGDVHAIDKPVARAEKRGPKRKAGTGKLIWVAAGCVAVALIIVLLIANGWGEPLALSDRSSNVTVRYTGNPLIFQSGCLVNLTEEELFTEFDTAIFKGTISEIRNIVVSFNGEKEYRAIAKIKVEKVYRGTCNEGDTVSVMLPCPVSTIMSVTSTTTVSAMKAGMTGIFMPVEYDDESALWMENGARLDKRDIADYGFADGERYVFLETDSGLVFARYAYKSIADADTLEEVEAYIESMLESLYGKGMEE